MEKQFQITVYLPDTAGPVAERRYRLEKKEDEYFLIAETDEVCMAARLVFPKTSTEMTEMEELLELPKPRKSGPPADLSECPSNDDAVGQVIWGRIADLIKTRSDLSYARIAKEVNVSDSTVYAVARRFNLHRSRGRKFGPPHEEIADWIKQQPDWTYEQIATIADVSPRTVASVAKRFNLRRRKGPKLKIDRASAENLMTQ